MATFPVEVLTPEGKAYEGEAEMLSTRSGIGGLGIKANHAPLMAMLDPCELRLHTDGGEVVSFAQAEGYLQVVDNSALVLVEEAIPPEDLDQSTIQSQLDEARRSLEQAEEDTEEHHRYERDVERYEAFLEVAGS